MTTTNEQKSPTWLADRCPPEINDLLDEQVPGRDNATFRTAVRRACVEVLEWSDGVLAVPSTGEHQAAVVRRAAELLREAMRRRG